MAPGIRFRLSTMMFLEFFIWGGWFVTMGSFLSVNLSATGAQSALAYSTQSWGAIVAPLFIGLVADRYFNAEKLLGIIHILGAALMYSLATAASFDGFYPRLLGYMILYMPTLALVNVVSFRQMSDPARQFSQVRVWGTVGWIVAGLVISYGFAWDSSRQLAAGALRNTFLMCAAASLALGMFSFTLPATPPRAGSGERQTLATLLGADALQLLRDRNFLVFFIASVLVCIPLAFYYQHANQFLTEIQVENATGKQTLGQVSEVFFMLLIPFFLGRIGMKGTLLLGMLAWSLRYVLFAYGDPGPRASLLLAGIALHGACYDFFFVSGQVYADSKAGERCKTAAQGLITLATYGVGMLVGFSLAGQVTDHFAAGGGHDWRAIWIVPACFAAALSVLFAMTFRNERIDLKTRTS